MSAEPLDERYFKWLYSLVVSTRLKSPNRTYWSLLAQLHSIEFVPLVANDDNRCEDGRDLRYEFLGSCEMSADDDWLSLPCSMLELLIGLARRLSFEDDGEPRAWFWQLLENINLDGLTDALYTDKAKSRVADIVDVVIWRNYQFNGEGGLFPLSAPARDQKKVELWYQMNAYLLENY